MLVMSDTAPRIDRPDGTVLATDVSNSDEASSIAGNSPVDVTHTAYPVVWADHSAVLMKLLARLHKGDDTGSVAALNLRRHRRFAAFRLH